MVQIQIHQRQTNSWTLNITASTECFLVILVTSDGPSRKRSCPFLLPRVSRDSSLKKKTLTLAPSREQTGQCLVPWPSSGTWSFLSTWAFICSECYRLDKFCPYARFPDLTILGRIVAIAPEVTFISIPPTTHALGAPFLMCIFAGKAP